MRNAVNYGTIYRFGNKCLLNVYFMPNSYWITIWSYNSGNTSISSISKGFQNVAVY
jgi:hypothetical protein